jgi:flagellar motility protein MotE (MotC chaperone)
VVDAEIAPDLALPHGARLLYIGPMKTGTTAIQAAARDQRQNLLDHGVRYPGNEVNHRKALGALLGWSTWTGRRAGPLGPDLLDVDTAGVPDAQYWHELKAEIDAETTRRVLVTHEFVSQADDAACRRIIDELGPDRVHVAITLRPPAAILPSLWAQNIKDDAQAEPFESWVARIYGRDPNRPMPDRFQRAYDQGELVRRWTGLIGPDKVTIIVVDNANPNLLTGAFETLLELPTGTFAREEGTNRSLTAVEARLFRQLNAALREHNVDWRAFKDLIWRGAINQGPLARRSPPPEEPRVQLPYWASDAAQRDGKRFADTIRDCGVRVVGDLEALSAVQSTAEEVDPETVPIDISVQALTGSILAGQQVQHRAKKRAHQLEAAREQNQQLEGQLTTVKDQLATVKDQLATIKDQLAGEKKRTLEDRAHARKDQQQTVTQRDHARRRIAELESRTLRDQVKMLPSDARADNAARSFTTHDLFQAITIRLRHKLGTGKSMRLN